MTGRKRHIVVDTIGLLLAIVVHAADIQDRDGAKLVINKLIGRFPRLKLIWADAGYAGQLVDWVQALTGWILEEDRRVSYAKGIPPAEHIGCRSSPPEAQPYVAFHQAWPPEATG